MKELKYIDYTKGNEGHILIPSCKSVYPDMGVGTAQQIQTNIHESDSTPYVFRKTPYNSTRESGELVGASVAWNQIFRAGSNQTLNDVVFDHPANDWSEQQMNGTASATVYKQLTMDKSIIDHVYYVDKGSDDAPFSIYNDSGGITTAGYRTVINKATAAKNFYIRIQSGQEINVTVKPMVADLTLMLGSAIADYLATLETGTAGAGIAKLREWGFFDKPYYAYNAGAIESVNVSKHKMTGLNQWDKTNENVNKGLGSSGELINSTGSVTSDYLPILPETEYYFKNVLRSYYGRACAFYDGGKNFISVKSFSGGSGYVIDATRTTPANARYIRVTRWNTIEDVCLNISNAAVNGTYEPYTVNEYPLDSDLALRGILELDGSNNLHADGDVYHPDGKVDRNWSETPYTLTSGKTWTAWGQSYYTYVGIDSPNNNDGFNAFSDILPAAQAGALFDGSATTGIGAKSGNIYISASDYANLSNLIGMNIYIRKATPTTETADPYNEVQVCSPYGTEEFVDAGVTAGTRDVAIPCGHSTEYMKNIVGAIEGIPLPPTTNGNFKLRCTVASGVPTYSWVSE